MKNNLCVQSHGQSKALVGAEIANVFEFVSPIPLGSPPGGSLDYFGDSQELTFSGETPIEIEALTDGRRKLALKSAPTMALTGGRGAAFVVSDQINWPCLIQKFTTEGQKTYAYVADALPATLPAGETCYLYFAYYSAPLPSCDFASGPHRLEVTYSSLPQFGGCDESQLFFLVYVHQIFSTGLTETDLKTYFKGFNPNPSIDAGIPSALLASEDWIVERIRQELRETGQTEDDVLAPQTFRRAQLLYAAAHAFLLTDTNRFELLKKEANFAFRAACSQVFIDHDHDGNAEKAESTTIGKAKSDVQFFFGRRRPRW